MFFTKVKFNVVESKSDSIVITVTQKSRAGSFKDAQIKAEHIGYSYTVSDNNLIFDPYFTVDMSDQYRRQEVFITLAIPVGKSVFLGDGSSWIVYDIKNITNTRDRQMIGKYWTMTQNGLECQQCNFMTDSPRRSVNVIPDLNSMTLRQLKNQLSRITTNFELNKLDFEKNLNRKNSSFEKQMIRWEEKLKNTSSTRREKEYRLKLEELKSDLKIELKKMEIQFDSQIQDFENMKIEIENMINEKGPIEKKKKTVDLNDDDSHENQSGILTRLSFPTPFRIFS
jgi:hypothetical protein